MHTQITEYTADRFSIPMASPFVSVVGAFEAAVPALDQQSLADAIAKHRDWDTVETWTEQHAPHGFIRYWRNEPTALMAIAGHQSSCVSYLVGNHVVAERMYRFDPRVMGLAPFRVTISQRPGEPVLLTADVPSASFGSFGDGRITAVAHRLDREFAQLLIALGASVPEVLAEL
ncbi:hypothetical protein BJK06_04740 [Curtobacterium sp. BH-2-1-1]|uniref:hypothetical protein n=1 Tax=Curtobacterium sp. BH-2-1-1 TaxID=1905847 RepID=UPI00089E03B6|nr:hypothetical protein [Curtobacterium sp. BH-2-1-1]AOX65156.1 hypothetical protein BJK06_04740 [Curtobacterium sp. BH-2-1-1]